MESRKIRNFRNLLGERVAEGAVPFRGGNVSTRISLRATKRLKKHEAEMRFHVTDCTGFSGLLYLIQNIRYKSINLKFNE